MNLLITIETGDITHVLESSHGHSRNVRSLDIDGWGRTRVVSSPLVF